MSYDETAAKRSELLRRYLADQSMGASGINARIPRRQPGEHIPLSFTEERLWFLDQLVPGNPFYVETAALPIRGGVTRRALEQCVNAVVVRHEILRTTFVLDDVEPVQRIVPSLHIPLPLVDLSACPAARQPEEVARLAAEEATRPFDLSVGPLLRTTLLRLGSTSHVFLLAVHHIVSDGWSMQVFSREVSSLYATLVSGVPLHLTELPIQYADYAIWQRSRVRDGSLATQLDYWRRQLADLPVIALPTDYPRPPLLAYRGGSQEVRIPSGLSDYMKELSRREGTTLFMTGLAAFAALLARYTGQQDLPIGVPVAGRERPELEPLIGCFLNTIVLRIDVAGDPSFRELLGRVRTVAIAGYDNQEFPFDGLVHELQPCRDLGHNPLFQVMFQHFTAPSNGDALASAETVPVERGTAIVDLFYHLWDSGHGIEGRIDFSTELFEPRTIGAMAQHFLVMLTAAVRNPDLRISELPILTAAEYVRALECSSGAARPYGEAIRIETLFEQQVARTPEATALLSETGAVTYANLNREANRLAGVLRSRGVGRRSVVAVCLERSPEAVSAVLAILKAGAAWVSLDITHPKDLLAYLLDDSGAKLTITRSELRDRLLNASQPTICLDTDRALIDAVSRENAKCAGPPEDLAYLIYTSGSTGHPKGVMADHVATFNRFRWMWEAFPFSSDEVAAQRTALSFVDSVWEMLGPLLVGVPSVILPDQVVRDPARLVDRLAAHRVTRLLVVPSLLRALVDSGIEFGVQLPHVKLWFSSGEALDGQLMRWFIDYVADGRLVNLYGSSEVAGDVTCAVLSGDPGDAPAPIGKPIANTAAYVLDVHHQLVPPGVAGRLYVAGRNLAQGYHRQPRLTAERFLPNPFSDTPGDRMYDTGDRARWTVDEQLEYLGRFDHQAKVRGYRVELEGLESVLAAHPRVRSAAVTTAVDSSGVIQLEAFFVPGSGEVSPSELRSYLRTKVPDYMVPSDFVALEALPLKPNGKVDRTALPAVHRSTVDDRAYVAPRTEIEGRLAEMWQEVLQVDRIGIHDNFFDIGGHSLMATRLMSRIRQQLAVELPLQTIFESPTIAELGESLADLMIVDLDRMTDDEALQWLDATSSSNSEEH
jgi:amino acid adenylation domain-containing protein